MARYQLFRTSPYMTGQVMVDVLVNKNSDTQRIWGDEIHLSPIDPNIIYNESDKRDMMRYSHGENVKDLYSQISSQFYSAGGEYSDHIWLYDVDGWPMDPFSHTYMMGPRRMRFSRYKKQFSYFMPLWISEYTDFSKFRFIIHASGPSDKEIITGSFRFSPEICKYFQDYMDNTASGTPISDNIMSIDFENKNSYIQGLEVSTGRYVTRDTSYILDFLLKRERPILETDYNIIDLFRQNLVVSQQLINFNFVFNLRDISGAWPEYYTYGKKLRFWIEAQYEGKSLPLKDLYTNYNFIPKYNLISMSPSTRNCLDFLKDNLCIDMNMDNKFTQPVIHWALKDNPKYIFNLYSGCSPMISIGSDLTKDMIMNGGSFNWVDVSLTEPDPWRQNWKWAICKKTSSHWETQYIDAMHELSYGNRENFDRLFTPISIKKDSVYVGSNLFYRFINDNDKNRYKDLEELDAHNYYITIVIDESMDPDEIDPSSQLPIGKYDFRMSEEVDDNICIVMRVKSITDAILYNLCHYNFLYDETLQTYWGGMYFSTNNIPEAFIQFMQYITGTKINETIDQTQKYKPVNLWQRWKKPMKIEYTEGLQAIPLGTDVLGTMASEISYADDDDYYTYMYRYSGKLIPFFTDITSDLEDDIYRNFTYGYFQWKDSDTDIIKKYSKILKQRIGLSYPSVMLNDVVGCTPWIEYKSNSDAYNFYQDWPEDIIWNRKSLLWNLPVNVKFNIELPRNLSDTEIKEALWTGFKQALQDSPNSIDHPLLDTIHQNDSRMRNYIEHLYSKEQQFEYKAIDDIDHIIYTVTYKLR